TRGVPASREPDGAAAGASDEAPRVWPTCGPATGGVPPVGVENGGVRGRDPGRAAPGAPADCGEPAPGPEGASGRAGGRTGAPVPAPGAVRAARGGAAAASPVATPAVDAGTLGAGAPGCGPGGAPDG